MLRTHARTMCFTLAVAAPLGGLGGCSQPDNPQIPKVAVPEPPPASKALEVPNRGGATYGSSSKYQELMNKKDRP